MKYDRAVDTMIRIRIFGSFGAYLDRRIKRVIDHTPKKVVMI
jgi:hypothetical protein